MRELHETWETGLRELMEEAQDELDGKCEAVLKEARKYTDKEIRTILGPTVKEAATARKNGFSVSQIFNRLQKFEKRVETL